MHGLIEGAVRYGELAAENVIRALNTQPGVAA
jgi:hypothetical protein